MPFTVVLPDYERAMRSRREFIAFCAEQFGPDAIPEAVVQAGTSTATWALYRQRLWTWTDTLTFRFAREEDAVTFTLFAA